MIKYFFLIISLILISFYLAFKKQFFFNRKNNKIKNFKKKFINTQARIEKIFLRNNERLINDPNLDLIIGLYEEESDLKLKTNIHRARLAKFNKSKLNGEYIYQDLKGNIYKIKNKNKVYI
tara:strand:+ start:30 stop:392 length:363 start_codon:yes stop_codon:yes gene_type:complete